MELSYAELSVPGRHRERNEDHVGFWQSTPAEPGCCQGALAVLADGVGSLRHADVASRLAVESAVQNFREARSGGSVRHLLIEACRAANWSVYATGLRDAGDKRMGSTLAMAAFCHDEVTVGNVGDSRVYHVRGPQVRQLSTDHTLTGTQQRYGLMNEEEARTSAERHWITRSLGQQAEVNVDINTAMMAAGDLIVLCSDGLHAVLNDREIGEIVSHAVPLEACRRLVALAQHRGSDDDISVQIVQVTKLDHPRPASVAADQPTAVFRADPQPGQTFDNRFLLTDVLARSGMAIIFRAIDLSDNASVAIKLPLPTHAPRLHGEAEALRQFAHPYILRFIAAASGPVAYLATEFVRGYTLSHLLRNICPLPEDEVIKIAGRLCGALAHVHERGFVHRDLKPGNVMLCHDDTLRLMDFGLTTRAEAHASFFRRFGPTVGTADYIAPEQLQGRAWDARTDLYGLGAMMYEMLTGVAPFTGRTPKDVMQARLQQEPTPPSRRNPNVSPAMERLVLRALARSPSARPQTAHELEAALAGLRS